MKTVVTLISISMLSMNAQAALYTCNLWDNSGILVSSFSGDVDVSHHSISNNQASLSGYRIFDANGIAHDFLTAVLHAELNGKSSSISAEAPFGGAIVVGIDAPAQPVVAVSCRPD